MEEEEVSVCALPWCWVIETLARSQLVDIALLYELVSKAPSLSGDSGKKARDVVALRCLDDLFGPINGSSDDHFMSHQLKHGFDPLESCEDVLERILCETSGSNLRKDASDELKQKIHSFIKHKKASLPRCALELLKNTIVEGTHPVAASLKEISALTPRNQPGTGISPGVGNPTSSPLWINEINRGSQPVMAEEDSDSLRPEIGDQIVQPNLPNGNPLHSERVTSHVCVNDHVQEADDASHDKEIRVPPVKKQKMDIPVGGSEMSNDAEDEQNHRFPKENGTDDGKSFGENFADQAKIDVGNHNQPQISPNNDEGHPEEIDFAKRKLTFLSSQSVFSQDSLIMTETQANICMKCNEGGQLLTCSASACPLLFHESCLGCSASFDDQGNFYCPFCAYSRAISEYVRAKKKVSLARKELSLFIGGRNSSQQQRELKRSLVDDVNQQRQTQDSNKAEKPKNGANDVTQNAAPKNFPSEIGQEAEITIQLARDVTRIQNQAQGNHGSDGGKISHVNEKITDASEGCVNLKATEGTTGHQVESHGDSSSESISNSDGRLEDEKNKATTSLTSPRPLSEIPTTPRSRRKKVPWTVEEEAMLKEGVQKFAEGDGRAIPWKSILEFGSSVFLKGRTAIDLKDKWRNMLRGGSPKVK